MKSPLSRTDPVGRRDFLSNVGKGLGLYLAKTIIETAGGQIGFHAAESHGTVFWVELPRAEASALRVVVT
jgi:signal transduction histidine kinase